MASRFIPTARLLRGQTVIRKITVPIDDPEKVPLTIAERDKATRLHLEGNSREKIAKILGKSHGKIVDLFSQLHTKYTLDVTMHPSRWSSEDSQKTARLFNDGWSSPELGALLGRDHTSVLAFMCYTRKVQGRNSGVELSEADRDKICAMRIDGLSWKEIGESFVWTPRMLSRVLWEFQTPEEKARLRACRERNELRGSGERWKAYDIEKLVRYSSEPKWSLPHAGIAEKLHRPRTEVNDKWSRADLPDAKGRRGFAQSQRRRAGLGGYSKDTAESNFAGTRNSLWAFEDLE